MTFPIGDRIRAARALSPYTSATAFAAELTRRGERIQRSKMYELEQGKTIPTPGELTTIAAIAGVPLAWFTADFSRLDEIALQNPYEALERYRSAAHRRSGQTPPEAD